MISNEFFICDDKALKKVCDARHGRRTVFVNISFDLSVFILDQVVLNNLLDMLEDLNILVTVALVKALNLMICNESLPV